MRLRFTLFMATAGLLAAGYFHDVYLLFITAFGSGILYSMRCIEYQIGDLKGRIPGQAARHNASVDDAFQFLGKAYAKDPSPEMREKVWQAFYISNPIADLEDGIAFQKNLDRAGKVLDQELMPKPVAPEHHVSHP